MRFFNRRKQPPIFTRQNMGALVIMGALLFMAMYTQVRWLPHEHDDRNIITMAFSPPATPTPDPMIVANEELTNEVIYISEDNKRMTEYILASRGGDRKPKEVVNYAKLSAPRYIVELIERMCASHGFDSGAYIYSIVAYESQFNPACHNTRGEDSRGLLQVNVADPSHAKRNPNKTKLFDPAYNLDYQLDELKLYYKTGKQRGLSGADLSIFIAKYGQRPKWGDWIAQEIKRYYAEYKNSIVKEI
jgi:hypothetical protein